MKIAILQPSDFHQLADIQPAEWYDPIPIHQFYHQAPYCFSFKVERNGNPVGVGTIIYHEDVAWLAHILVHKDHQRNGIGKKITKYLLDHALKKGLKTVYLIATDMGAPVYSKLGFKEETEYVIYKDIEYNNKQTPSQHIIPYSKAHQQAVFALDALITGENRIDNLCLNVNTGYVYLDQDEVTGFYLPNLGDGVIMAKDAKAGQAFMAMRLQSTHTTAIFPKDNFEAMQFMDTLNVKPSGYMKRMIYGEKRSVKFTQIYNRIGGNLG